MRVGCVVVILVADAIANIPYVIGNIPKMNEGVILKLDALLKIYSKTLF
jgi:hypothetical protein